jgi:hypothetical protein
VLVDSTPEPVLPTGDANHDLIQMPLVSGCRETAGDLVGNILTELQRPLPHGLMADQDAAGSQHFLDHPQTERKPNVQPDGMADHFSRKAVTGLTRMTGVLHPSLCLYPVTRRLT